MSQALQTRRRMIRSRGRQMTLRRAGTGGASVDLIGFASSYSPEQTQGAVSPGDQQVQILNDEIAAASWPAPPRKDDKLVLDGRTAAVKGAWPVHDGALLIGWRLWISGG